MNQRAARIEKGAYIALVMAIGVITACIPQYPEGLEPIPKAGVLAGSLGNAYQANPVRWNRDIRGDLVRARGRVADIKASGSVVFAKVDAITNQDDLICHFSNLDEVAGLKRRMDIVVEGKVDDVIEVPGGYVVAVHLIQCRLVP